MNNNHLHWCAPWVPDRRHRNSHMQFYTNSFCFLWNAWDIFIPGQKPQNPTQNFTVKVKFPSRSPQRRKSPSFDNHFIGCQRIWQQRLHYIRAECLASLDSDCYGPHRKGVAFSSSKKAAPESCAGNERNAMGTFVLFRIVRGSCSPSWTGADKRENDEGQDFLNTLLCYLRITLDLQGYQQGAVTSAMTSLSWRGHVSTFPEAGALIMCQGSAGQRESSHWHLLGQGDLSLLISRGERSPTGKKRSLVSRNAVQRQVQRHQLTGED